MKYNLILLISLFSIAVNAQNLSDSEIEKLSKLEVQISTTEQQDIRLTNHLKEILQAEKSRKSNKTSGIILTSLSVLSIGYGTLVFSTPTNSIWDENPYSGVVGGIFVGAGIIKGGIGIPLLFVSKKRKMKRDKLIMEYQEELK